MPETDDAPRGAPRSQRSRSGGQRARGGASDGSGASGREAPLYGALDLGTNNCRLLIARPARDGFRVVDSFSRIVRLGEGLSRTGRLDDAEAVARRAGDQQAAVVGPQIEGAIERRLAT